MIFFPPHSELFSHDWTGTKNSETVACFVSCVADILIRKYILLSSLGIGDCVQKLMGLNNQIYKYQNMAQQLIQTPYFIIHMFSERYPSNLLYSSKFYFIHLTLIILAFVQGWTYFYALGLHTPTCCMLPPLTEISSYLRSKNKEFFGSFMLFVGLL